MTVIAAPRGLSISVGSVIVHDPTDPPEIGERDIVFGVGVRPLAALTLVEEAAAAVRLSDLDSGDLFGAAKAIASLVDGPVTIEDLQSRVIAYSGRQEEADESRIQTILGRRVPDRIVRRLQQEVGSSSASLTRRNPSISILARCPIWRARLWPSGRAAKWSARSVRRSGRP